MKSIYKYSLVLLLGLGACEKSLDVKLPSASFPAETVFETDDLAQAAMRGIYASMTDVIASAKPFQTTLSTTLGLLSDELVRGSYSDAERLLFENNVSPQEGITGNMWITYYNYILQAHMAMEGAERSTGLSAGVRRDVMAEARFIRALCYFHLVNLYGPVPLVLNSDYASNTLMARTPVNEVYKVIVDDLLYAQDNLLGNSTAARQRHRPSRWTATALLARVYLYQKNWAAAEEAATAVIRQSNIYRLENLATVFKVSSRETLWALLNAGNKYTTDVHTLQGPATSNSAFHLSAYIVSRFDNNDQRKIQWTKTIGTTTASYKFKVYNNSGTDHESVMVLRLAEQYLIRAEARAMQSKLSEAIEDIDVIRTRAGAAPDDEGDNSSNTFKTIAFSRPDISADELIAEIYDERVRELFAELGQRWFDVKRAPQGFLAALGDRKPGIEETDALLPIPNREIQYNQNLVQNDGY